MGLLEYEAGADSEVQ